MSKDHCISFFFLKIHKSSVSKPHTRNSTWEQFQVTAYYVNQTELKINGLKFYYILLIFKFFFSF